MEMKTAALCASQQGGLSVPINQPYVVPSVLHVLYQDASTALRR
ncbi:Protein of unknown function [Pyronema omphalodes CBS 100304]|uniref:Uncharacterized protein n=1 Tax=Pyronema omphalodes (strain CBS 100304) TaxID=1076935 RepID=U4LTH6_PYROM|nr:Protein of unknown function [Pyronema omphalodes CBS 100304]